jgi:hypothetical protein
VGVLLVFFFLEKSGPSPQPAINMPVVLQAKLPAPHAVS